MVIQKAQVEYLLLTILDSRLRGNDKFFQSIPSLPVIPAKAGIQELIDNLGIVDKQNWLLCDSRFFVTYME